MKKLKYVLAGLLALSTVAFAAGKLQNSDFATSAEITGAGGSNSQLLNTSKIWDNVNSQLLNTTLSGFGTGNVVGPGSATDNAVCRFDGTTGKLLQNSGASLDDSGNLTATSFIGPVTGNASTASALAANPSDCASDTYAGAIAANGNLTCSTVTDAGLATPYIKADGTRGLSADWNAGAHNITATTFIGALTGNSSTASALAANPSDCSAGQYANAIAANGNLTCSGIQASELPAPTTSTISASNIDWSTLKNVDGLYTKTLAANTTLTWSNVTAGQTIVIALTNTASNYTVTWPAAAKWAGGSAPTQTIGAKTDVITCKAYDSTNAYCVSQQNF